MKALTKETIKIMLVENDENDVFFLRRALTHAGYTNPLIHLQNGKAAVNYFKTLEASSSASVPDIALMDIKMPVMDGFDVLSWLRQESSFKELPVIMLSSSDDLSDMTKSRRLGIYKFLTKQVHYDNVISSLESFLLLPKGPPSP